MKSIKPADLMIVARRILARRQREKQAALLRQSQPPADSAPERGEQRGSNPSIAAGTERAEP